MKIRNQFSDKKKKKGNVINRDTNPGLIGTKKTTSCLEALYYYERKQIHVYRVQIYPWID